MCKDRISFAGNLSIHLVNVQRGLCVPLIAHFFPMLFIASIQAKNPFGGIQALDLVKNILAYSYKSTAFTVSLPLRCTIHSI